MDFNIREYTDNNGNCPFENWLNSLDVKFQARIEARISRFKKGLFGDCKMLGDGIWEARFFFGPGYRLYFSKQNQSIVLLLVGGDKSTQSKDIKLAKEFLDDYERMEKSGTTK